MSSSLQKQGLSLDPSLKFLTLAFGRQVLRRASMLLLMQVPAFPRITEAKRKNHPDQ